MGDGEGDHAAFPNISGFRTCLLMPVSASILSTYRAGMLFRIRQLATTLGFVMPSAAAAFDMPPRASIALETGVISLMAPRKISRCVMLSSPLTRY